MQIDTNGFLNVYRALKSNGVSGDILPLAIAQCCFESAAFTSNGFINDNNPSGILDGNGIKQYDSLNDWANDYVNNFLSVTKYDNANGTAPINTTNLNDFVTALIGNHYCTDKTVAQYSNGINTYLPDVLNMVKNQKNSDNLFIAVASAVGIVGVVATIITVSK